MSSHPYEYKVLVEYINPKQKGQKIHFTNGKVDESFTKILEDVFDHLPESIPEGWEVNSHGITVSRDTIIVTILLRRTLA